MGLFDNLKKMAKEIAKEALDGVATAAFGSGTQEPEKTVEQVQVPQEPEVKAPIEYTVTVDFELNQVADGEYEIVKFVGFEEESMEIPAEINGQRIVGIADEVFFQLGTIINIKIADGIRYIGKKVFAECPDLESVVLPETLERIGAHCFSETQLEEIKLPASVVEVGEGAFLECKELLTAVLPENLEVVPAHMFNHCEKLENITFPNNLSVVGDKAFYCTALILKSLPDTITAIGDYGFYGCFQDEDGYCPPVEELRLPSGLKTVGYRALSGLNCLKLIVPASVTHLGERAFDDLGYTDGEVSVIFEEGCSAALPEGLFFNGSMSVESTLKSITIPSQITEIGKIFYGKDEQLEAYDVTDEYGRHVYDERGNRMYNYKRVEVTYDKAPEELTIYCDPGSAAMKFARENGINCAKREV